MKKFILCLFLIALLYVPAISMNLPEPTGYVVDTIGLLRTDTIEQITTICTALDKKTQVAVLVVGTTQPDSIEQYSIKLAEKWKVGYKGVDNGIIIILAKIDRKVRIEVGRGTEAIITDAKASKIVNDVIIPCFKKGDWDGGIIAGLKEIEKEVQK